MSGTTVAIIGGGFSGTVAAIRLLTSSQNGGPSLPFGSDLIEGDSPLHFFRFGNNDGKSDAHL